MSERSKFTIVHTSFRIPVSAEIIADAEEAQAEIQETWLDYIDGPRYGPPRPKPPPWILTRYSRRGLYRRADA